MNISVNRNEITIDGSTHTLQPGESITVKNVTAKCDDNGHISVSGHSSRGVTNISSGGNVAVQGGIVNGLVIRQ